MTHGPWIVAMFHVKHGPRPAIGGGFLIEKYDWPAARGGGIFEVRLILAGTERIEKMLTIEKPRSLAAIAADIRRTWQPKVYFGAAPYLDAMRSLDSMSNFYGEDSARSIVAYFLANAGTWRGEDARRIKAELKGML